MGFFLKLAELLLHPLARLRLWLFQRGFLASTQLPGIVISVGNITLGGTGKSPTVIALCQHLKSQGHRPVILTRGYRSGLSKDQSVIFCGDRQLEGHGPKAPGPIFADEARMQAHKLGDIPVIVGQDRRAAAQSYLSRHPAPSHWLLDDGFQHLRLKRNFDLVLFDAKDPLNQGAPIWARLLREPLSSLKRADAVLLTRGGEASPDDFLDQVAALRKPFYAAIFTNEAPVGRIPFPRTGRIGLVAAIARPERLLSQLPIAPVATLFKPDHRTFAAAELAVFVRGLEALVTTEKDYWRHPDLFEQLPVPVFTLPLVAELPAPLLKALGNLGKDGRNDI